MLVQGSESKFGSLTTKKIGNLYLQGQNWELVEDGKTAEQFEGGLFLVGSIESHPLLKKLIYSHGVRTREDGSYFRGARLLPGVGLIIRGTTPAGGPFTAFTGVDEASVYSCFTVSTSATDRLPNQLVYQRKFIRWEDLKALSEREALKFEDKLQIFRADEIVWRHISKLMKNQSADAAFAIAKEMQGYQWEYNQIWGGSGPSPSDFIRYFQWIAGQQDLLLKTQARFDRTNLSTVIDQVYAQCRTELGNSRLIAPQLIVLVATAEDTNAKTAGLDPISQRPRVLINLAAIPDMHSLRLIVAHEFIHTFQFETGGTLSRDLFWLEGVASAASQAIISGTPDHVALMWSEDQLAIAQKYHDAAVKEFFAAREVGGDILKSWFIEGRSPARNNALPDRMGYYLGWYAAKKWLAADESRTLKDLLETTPEQLLGLLQE